MVRDAVDGTLWVLEVNPSGATWHISSDYFEPYRETFDLDLHAQFGALDIIADAVRRHRPAPRPGCHRPPYGAAAAASRRIKARTIPIVGVGT